MDENVIAGMIGVLTALIICKEALAEAEKQEPELITRIAFPESNIQKPAQEVKCNPHPDAPHGFMRDASISQDRYVCECEYWEQPAQETATWQSLSDDEIFELSIREFTKYEFARAIDKALKEKNHAL